MKIIIVNLKGHIKYCNYFLCPYFFMKDLLNKVLGRLTVIEYAGFYPSEGYKKKRHFWKVKCSCERQTEKTVREDAITKDKPSLSCGCLIGESVIQRNTTHGMTGTPEHNTWEGMINRCYNVKNKKYPLYGGRGIKVCDRWLVFENFFEDMGLRPSSDHSLDRFPNQNGNYEKSNCRWATDFEQNANTSRNHWIKFRGEKHIVAEWSRILGIDQKRISENILDGKTMDYIVAKYSKDKRA